jgi:hypothetical protein
MFTGKRLALFAFGCLMTSSSASANTVSCTGTSPANNLIAGAPTTSLTSTPSDTYEPCSFGELGLLPPSLGLANVSYDLVSGAFTTAPPSVTDDGASVASDVGQMSLDPDLQANSELLLEYQVTGSYYTASVLVANFTGNAFVNETVCTVFTTGLCPSADLLALLDISGSGYTITLGSACVACTSGGVSSGLGLGEAAVSFGGTYQSNLWIIDDINSGSTPFSFSPGDFGYDIVQSYSIPEPMTFSLIGGGIVGLFFMRRFRQCAAG